MQKKMDRNNFMKVIFIPFSKDNPYQKELAASLLKHGVYVIDEIGFSNFSFTLSLLKAIYRNWKPAILHFHWLEPFMYDCSRLTSISKSIIFITDILIIKLLGIRVIWTVHNLVIHDSKFVKFEFVIISFFARLCNGIIVHTSSALNEVVKHYGVSPDLVTIIPHGNYIKSYKNNISRMDARIKLDIPENEHVLLYFGRIRPYKGVDNLIETFNRIDQKHLKLIIAGKALNQDMANGIKKKCQGNQNIFPVITYIPDDEVQVYMNAADVVVLPYKNIFTSGALLLAMSFGKAIIAPSTGSIPDILGDNGGFLFDPLHPAGLKTAIENSLDSDLASMGRYNFEQAKKYDWDTIAGMTYSFYRKHTGQISGLADINSPDR